MNDNKSAYNSLIYDDNIRKVLPYYNEFNNQVLDVVKSVKSDKIRWLDSGCGTGILALRAKKELDKIISFTMCDPSADMLSVAKERLGAYDDVQFKNISSQQLEFKNEFDVVTTIQCHHYLKENERKNAVSACKNALKKGGIYITFENIRLTTEASDAIGNNRWCRYMLLNGRTDEQVQAHMERRGTEVFPITIEEHLKLLRECGFNSADVLWTSYMQAGFIAIK